MVLKFDGHRNVSSLFVFRSGFSSDKVLDVSLSYCDNYAH